MRDYQLRNGEKNTQTRVCRPRLTVPAPLTPEEQAGISAENERLEAEIARLVAQIHGKKAG